MQPRNLALGLSCLLGSSLVAAGPALADRRTGLAGNLLIQDPDDVFPFPQYTVQHRNMLRLDYGQGGDGSGNGVLTLGDSDIAFGLALHRGDLLSPDVVGFQQELAWLSGAGTPGAPPAFDFTPTDRGDPAGPNPVLPSTVADLSAAKTLGDDAVGLRLGFGRGIDAFTPDGGETQKASMTFFAGQIGYSHLPQEGMRLDLSANLVAAFGKVTDGDGEAALRSHALRAGMLARAYAPVNDMVDIGLLGRGSINNDRTKTDANKSNDLNFGLMAAIGPVIHVDRAQLAAYAGFDLGYNKTSPNTDDADADTRGLTWGGPMVNMAVDVQVLDWLYVRTGAQYTWELDWTKTSADKTRTSAGPFRWSAGLGMTKDNFSFDGVLQQAFVTNGPAFIGGDGGGFLAMASATYRFGDVFEGSTAPPAEAEAEADRPALDAGPELETSTEAEVEAGGLAETNADVDAEATGEDTNAEVGAEASAGISLGD